MGDNRLYCSNGWGIWDLKRYHVEREKTERVHLSNFDNFKAKKWKSSVSAGNEDGLQITLKGFVVLDLRFLSGFLVGKILF